MSKTCSLPRSDYHAILLGVAKVLSAIKEEIRGGFRLGGLDRRYSEVKDHESAGAALQGSEEEDKSGRGVPERDECCGVGDGDSLEEQWALKRYLRMDALEAVVKPNSQLSRH